MVHFFIIHPVRPNKVDVGVGNALSIIEVEVNGVPTISPNELTQFRQTSI